MNPFIRVALPLLILSLTACGGAARSMSVESATMPRASREERLVAQTAGLRLVSNDLPRIHRAADSLSMALGGYVEMAELRESELRMRLRVPADSLNPVLDRLSTMGRVRHRTVHRQDVTERVVDVDARLGTLRAVRDRLRGYLDRAPAIADVVQVERELTRVQGEIDALEAQQRMLAGRVELADVQLDATRPVVLGPLGWLVTGVATVIEKLFVIRD